MEDFSDSQLFRLKIAGKRQLTLPQRLLDSLGLSEGDEIQFAIQDGQISVHACKAVPVTMLSKEDLSKLQTREKYLSEGNGQTMEKFLSKIPVIA